MTFDLRALLHRLFFPDDVAAREIAEQVKKESAQLRRTAVAVRERLDEYASSHDPFVAMLADIYERRQEANIWRGPAR